jgi:hypothetical protein
MQPNYTRGSNRGKRDFTASAPRDRYFGTPP